MATQSSPPDNYRNAKFIFWDLLPSSGDDQIIVPSLETSDIGNVTTTKY